MGADLHPAGVLPDGNEVSASVHREDSNCPIASRNAKELDGPTLIRARTAHAGRWIVVDVIGRQ